MRTLRPGGVVLGLALATIPLAAGERELNARWQGAWVVARLVTYSDCGRLYTNNEVRHDLVVAKGRMSFPSGELARVAKVNLNSRRAEVFLDLLEPVLLERREGPFLLYDESACRVELRVPRDGGSESATENAMAALLERYPTEALARSSALWNERRRADYPPDYDQTLVQYESWRVQQANLAVQRRLDEAIEETALIARRIDDDPDYLAGFAAGAGKGRDEYYSSDCESLLAKSVGGAVGRAPKGHTSDWNEGYEDGQRLLFFSEMAKRLRGCFVPPPAQP
jgi:hypothetical protein